MNGGTVSVIPNKRVLEETEEGHVEIPKPNQSCHLTPSRNSTTTSKITGASPAQHEQPQPISISFQLKEGEGYSLNYSAANIEFTIKRILSRVRTNQDTSGKTATHDFLIYSNHQELGYGEIKVNGVGERLQEEDRARLGERLKKQLHHRIKEAKSSREFYVFGVFITDNIMELYRSSFSKENGYNLVLLSKIMLPTLGSTYTSIEESLEILFSFKESIINTMQDPSECERPYIYREYYNYLKPTVSFI
ncbi:hypothetical protein AB4K20DRAFT_1965905 [Rhizopus microsporus]